MPFNADGTYVPPGFTPQDQFEEKKTPSSAQIIERVARDLVRNKTYKINFTPPRFMHYLPPQGFLQDHPACHALFHYAITARASYETQMDPIKYEDDPEEVYNFKQLFQSIATLHGVAPEQMLHYWVNVDMQMRMLKLPLCPQHLRFTSVPEIRTV